MVESKNGFVIYVGMSTTGLKYEYFRARVYKFFFFREDHIGFSENDHGPYLLTVKVAYECSVC